MSRAVLLKLNDETFQVVEKVVHAIGLARNAYLNRAVDFYNRLQLRRMTGRRLKKEAALLKNDTREILDSYELLEDQEE